jgi:PAS domain S-box-containing protein
MKNRPPVTLAGILLFLGYCIFAAAYWQSSLNRTSEAIAEHSRIVAKSIWNLDNQGSVEYLNAMVEQLDYDHLVITETDGTLFIEIVPDAPGSVDQLLIRMKLIPLIPFSAAITYDGKHIGEISVIWRCKVIYPYAYVLLVACLLFVVVLLYDRVLNEKHKLASKVEQRTEELRKTMESLRKSEANFRLLTDISPVAIAIFRKESHLYVNPSWEELSGYSKKEAVNMSPIDMIHPDMRDEALKNITNRLAAKEAPKRYELKMLRKNGETLWFDFSAIVFNYNGHPTVLAVSTDITDRKNAEKEREVLIQKLQKALDEIKTLRGIIPVCSNCKSIRDDKGLWNQMEKYILEHSDAQFSHSLCPECAKKLYPDLEIYK